MKLVIFDSNKNISYFGESKLQFFKTKEEQCLKLIMLDKDPQETLTSTFDRVYIRKSNLLCCLDEESNNAFIVVFSSKESCDKIYDAMVKSKHPQPTASINEDEIFKDQFYTPLVKQVQAGIDGHEDLKSIVLNLVNSLDADERIVYMNVMSETLLVPSSFEEDKETILANVASTSDATIDSTGDTNLNGSRIYNMRKRSFNNISYKESDDEEDGHTKKPSSSKSTLSSCLEQPSPTNSSDDVIFDIVESLHDGKPAKKLLVFTSVERTHCYEFVIRPMSKINHCIGCLAHQKKTCIKFTVIEGGSKSFNFTTAEHACEPIEYLPSSYQSSLIVKSPNFKFTQRQFCEEMKALLIIFDPGNKDLCYRFGYDTYHKHFRCNRCKKQGIAPTARFIRHDGEASLELGLAQHRCQPQIYVSE